MRRGSSRLSSGVMIRQNTDFLRKGYFDLHVRASVAMRISSPHVNSSGRAKHLSRMEPREQLTTPHETSDKVGANEQPPPDSSARGEGGEQLATGVAAQFATLAPRRSRRTRRERQNRPRCFGLERSTAAGSLPACRRYARALRPCLSCGIIHAQGLTAKAAESMLGDRCVLGQRR
nr:hypothetical protein CFP56_56917 [Quercus suber]POE80850.1 hypothetical protein CFP56_56923 [Quercus suber]